MNTENPALHLENYFELSAKILVKENCPIIEQLHFRVFTEQGHIICILN